MPPIKPKEVAERRKLEMPEKVLEVWNTLITEKYSGQRQDGSGGSAHIKQSIASKAIANAMNVSEDQVFENRWLDIEEIYRDAGWHVKYDKPAYCETYDAYFEFTPKAK